MEQMDIREVSSIFQYKRESGEMNSQHMKSIIIFAKASACPPSTLMVLEKYSRLNTLKTKPLMEKLPLVVSNKKLWFIESFLQETRNICSHEPRKKGLNLA